MNITLTNYGLWILLGGLTTVEISDELRFDLKFLLQLDKLRELCISGRVYSSDDAAHIPDKVAASSVIPDIFFDQL